MPFIFIYSTTQAFTPTQQRLEFEQIV